MTLLTMVQEAAGSLNQPVPSAIFGATTGDAVLWRNLAQREGHDLAGRHDWQALIVQQTWTSTATQVQTSALPSDYDHLVPDVAIWDRTSSYPYWGPTSSVSWQTLQSSTVSGVGKGWWRIIGGDLYLYPAPAASHTFALEYITTKWCQSSGGTGQTQWAADTDVGLIPEDLMSLGLTWRWLKAKGMDYAEEFETYERNVEVTASRDRGLGVMTSGSPSADAWPAQATWAGTIS